jgi:uncharacterized membrane protein
MNAFPRDLDTLVDVILLSGLVLSVSFLVAGLVWQWLSTGTFGSFPTISASNLLGFVVYILRSIPVPGMGPTALVNSGIAVLLLTPFVRVVASVLFFGLREHNRIYTAFTGFVLIVLAIVLFVV